MLKVAVVIPTYKEELTPLEKISLAQCRKVLGRYPLIFFAPEGKIFSYFEPGDMIAHFPPQYFRSVETYCKLMLSPNFYETFKDFEYILIYQLDAFVFYDALEEFCSLGYDYIGAPWPYYAWSNLRKPKTPRVGNSGFCLRKVRSCFELLTEAHALPNMRRLIEKSYVDAFFAYCGVMSNVKFKTAPVEIANAFSMEHTPDRFVERFKNLPFGCHNWQRFSADFYVEIFARLGYNLWPYREQMSSEDYTRHLPNGLENLAMERLIRRAKNGRSLTHYLPTNHFASVRVVRNPQVMNVLARLVVENESLADEIFFYDEDEDDVQLLIEDLTRETLPHLVLTMYDEEDLIRIIERRGIFYGEHIISFRREYIKRCEKIFHDLGK